MDLEEIICKPNYQSIQHINSRTADPQLFWTADWLQIDKFPSRSVNSIDSLVNLM